MYKCKKCNKTANTKGRLTCSRCQSDESGRSSPSSNHQIFMVDHTPSHSNSNESHSSSSSSDYSGGGGDWGGGGSSGDW